MKTRLVFAVLFGLACVQFASRAEEKLSPLSPTDLYLLEGPQAVVVAPQGDRAAVVRRWIDSQTKTEHFALWSVEGDAAKARPLESGEPDARNAVYDPSGKWLAVRSTRPRPNGWKQTPSVPPESDAATDIWLISTDGKRAVPLAGADKPYGRVFNDPFYGRVAFSPDGKRLAFVADDGGEGRTPEEIAADVTVVREDQGEGYTGYRPAQVWIAELRDEPGELAASSIRRLTNDDVWYGDPQWTPDGKTIVCHANKSSDVEAVRYSINKNYDLWAIDVESRQQRRLTFGAGPEVSPRINPDGKELVCLSSPRKGPHADVFNLVVVSLDGEQGSRPPSRVVFDHHAAAKSQPPHPVPSFPLPEECWEGAGFVHYSTMAGIENKQVRLDLSSGKGSQWVADAKADLATASPIERRAILQRRLSPPGNSTLKERLKADERVIRWKNDEWELDGVLTVPAAEIAKPPYPLVLFPHGGPHSRSTKGFNFTAHAFAAKGYAVFQPNFRGSAGYGRAFLDADRNDLGGGDMRDILTGIESLATEGLIDRKRQFVYGVSYGGFMTTWLVGHTNQFRAAVAQNAVTDMNVMWGLSDIQSWTEHELGGLPWDAAEAMRKHSPLSYAREVSTPTLILHSRDDRRCPLPMGKMFYQSLLARGVPTQMVIYPNEGHGIRQPKHQVDVLERTLAWFAAHDVGASAEVITLGDSITKGVRPGVKSEETFAALLELSLREKLSGAKVTNVGIGGERTDQALARLERDVIARKPLVVTIMYGTNDSYVDPGKTASRLSLEEYRDNLVQIVERLRRAGIQPILMTEPKWGAKAKLNGLQEHPNVRLEKYVAACRDVAKELGVPLVDHYARWNQRETEGQNLGQWTTDECHPNPAGHREMAEMMRPVVQQAIGKLRRAD